MNPSHKKDADYLEQAYLNIFEVQQKKQSDVSTAIDSMDDAENAEAEAKQTGGKVPAKVSQLKKGAEKVIDQKTKQMRTAASTLNK